MICLSFFWLAWIFKKKCCYRCRKERERWLPLRHVWHFSRCRDFNATRVEYKSLDRFLFFASSSFGMYFLWFTCFSFFFIFFFFFVDNMHTAIDVGVWSPIVWRCECTAAGIVGVFKRCVLVDGEEEGCNWREEDRRENLPNNRERNIRGIRDLFFIEQFFGSSQLCH